MLADRILTRLAFSRDCVKLSLLKYRDFEGYFASMHQSGNHWLRHILAMILHEQFGTPIPESLADIRVIGEPKYPTKIKGIPRLVFSHKICSPLVHSLPFRAFVRFPRYVVMVRDLRAMLVSHFLRFREDYSGESFSEYLRGDVWGRRHDCDLWDSLRFLNAWGHVAGRIPDQVSIMRYEDLRADPVRETLRIWNWLQLGDVETEVVERAVAASTKEKMSSLSRGKESSGVIVRQGESAPLHWYSAEDRRWFSKACARYLRYDFGYDYAQWPCESDGTQRQVDATRDPQGAIARPAA